MAGTPPPLNPQRHSAIRRTHHLLSGPSGSRRRDQCPPVTPPPPHLYTASTTSAPPFWLFRKSKTGSASGPLTLTCAVGEEGCVSGALKFTCQVIVWGGRALGPAIALIINCEEK